MAQRKGVPLIGKRKPAPAQKRGEGCAPNEQTHSTFGFIEKGCTREEAKRAIIFRLLEKAEKERKVKCKGLGCLTPDIEKGNCVTTLKPDDLELIEKRIMFSPVLSKDCPQKIEWVAQLSFDIDETYRSICICAPRKKFI